MEKEDKEEGIYLEIDLKKYRWVILLFSFLLLFWQISVLPTIYKWNTTAEYVTSELKKGNCSALQRMYVRQKTIYWNGTKYVDVVGNG